jgi:hypothetical protein
MLVPPHDVFENTSEDLDFCYGFQIDHVITQPTHCIEDLEVVHDAVNGRTGDNYSIVVARLARPDHRVLVMAATKD